MTWSQSTSGLYQRPLGAFETPSVSSSAASEGTITREPIRIHTFADISATHSNAASVIDAFKEAWIALRLLKSPEIAATHQDGQKYYKVANKDELDSWQKKTFLVAKTGTPVNEIVREMQQRLEPLPTFYLIPNFSSDAENFKGSIILFIGHWMTEASGAFLIINQLCDYASDLLKENSDTRNALSQHTFGSEVKFLTPSLEDMVMPIRESNEESKRRIAAYFDGITLDEPVLEFPSNITSPDSSVKPSHMMQNQRVYTPSSTSALITACKEIGISVASAVHSAYLAAVWNIAIPSLYHSPYACIMPAQMRKRLPSSSSSSLYQDQGCWNSARLLFLTSPPGQDFLTRALDLRKQYMLAEDKIWQQKDIIEVNEQTTNLFIKAVTKSPAMPYITQMGLLDGDIIVSKHGSLTVEQVSVWADSLGLGVILGQWGFRGRLNLQISWNIAFHGEDQVQTTMETIDEILNQELGIDLQVESVKKVTF